MRGVNLALLERINDEINQIMGQRYQLLIIHGQAHSKEVVENQLKQLPISMINLNTELSRQLKEVPVNKRPRKVNEIVKSIINACSAEIIYLNYIEYLFDVELKQDPVSLLEHMSGNKVILVWWPGVVDNIVLKYAATDHPEYYSREGYEKHILTL